MRDQIDLNDKKFIEERYGKTVGWIPGAVNQKTGKINPQVTMAVLESGQRVSVFHVKPVYYETPAGHWRPLSEVTARHGNKRIELTKDWWRVHPRYLNWLDKRCKIIGGELLIQSFISAIPTPYTGLMRSIHESFVPVKIGLTTSTFYPDPDPETTTTSAACFEDRYNVWATARNSAASRVVYGNTSVYASIGNGNGASYYSIIRPFILFDTSTIPDADPIISAVYSGYCYSAGTQDGANPTIYVVSSTPASNTNIVTGDYDQVGSVDFGNKTSFTGSAYNDFTLNASGIAAISLTGVTKFGLRGYYDFQNSAPTEAAEIEVEFYNADAGGTSTDPKLVVVHGVTFIPYVSFIM
jgi:hypothetical protein